MAILAYFCSHSKILIESGWHFADAAAFDAADPATLVPAIAAITLPVVAIFGVPTADACAWASCRGGSAVNIAERIFRDRKSVKYHQLALISLFQPELSYY